MCSVSFAFAVSRTQPDSASLFYVYSVLFCVALVFAPGTNDPEVLLSLV